LGIDRTACWTGRHDLIVKTAERMHFSPGLTQAGTLKCTLEQ
jgi:hypothetical protein